MPGEKNRLKEEDNENSEAQKSLLIPSTEISEQSQVENMEVHKHPHHLKHKKEWGEYFLEFLMLFLAVTLGFFAENIREGITEEHRELQYINSLVGDLNQDGLNILVDIANRNQKNIIADSLTLLMLSASYQNQNSLIYYYARRFSIVGYVFHMTDGTLMQLKNSGGLRLIQKKNVVDSLQEYYNLYQQHEDNRELDMLQLRDYRDVMVRVFDVRVFNEMIKNFPSTSIPVGNPPLLNNNNLLINELLMRVELSKRINLVNIQYLTELKQKALVLIEQLKHEYNLSKN